MCKSSPETVGWFSIVIVFNRLIMKRFASGCQENLLALNETLKKKKKIVWSTFLSFTEKEQTKLLSRNSKSCLHTAGYHFVPILVDFAVSFACTIVIHMQKQNQNPKVFNMIYQEPKATGMPLYMFPVIPRCRFQ